MGNTPYSAKKSRSLPTFTATQDPATTFANWATQLAPGVQNVAPQATPQNFSISNSRGGLTLNWSPVLQASGADGYEILKSPSGSFTDDLQIIPVKDPNQSTFFDSMGGTPKTAFYRIRTTSGTAANPQSQRGPESGVIKHTSIDASDTTTTPVTFYDNYTTDNTRGTARRGNYGAIKLSSQSQPAVGRPSSGSGVVSGAAGVASRARQQSSGQNSSTGSGTGSRAVTGPPGSAPPPSSGTSGGSGTPFNNITSGVNTSATMVVQGGASIAPSASNPGTIDATQLQGTPVSTATPTSGTTLQYTGGMWTPTTIIAVGPQASLQSFLPLGLGELYVADDTGNLFMGTPGIGIGYRQIGDTTGVNETLLQILMELRALRLASVSLACQGGQASPQDFDPQVLATDAEIADRAQI